MERAEFAAGSIEVRGSGAIHRILSFLGAFFLGIGPGVPREEESENWWDRDDSAPQGREPVRMSLGRQAELFDEAGQATFTPTAQVVPRPVEDPAAIPVAKTAPKAVPQTVVSVRARSKTVPRVVTTARVAPATRVSAISRTNAGAARGAVARRLVMSQSISSGKEEARWFSVPQRVLLPRFQLFEGAAAVTEDAGGLRIGSRALRTQRGQVWFV